MSSSNIGVRVDPELKAEFEAAARKLDLTPSQVMRAFVRQYVEQSRLPEEPVARTERVYYERPLAEKAADEEFAQKSGPCGTSC